MGSATAKVLIQIALQALKDEETRKRLLMIILAPVLIAIMIITLIFYFLTNPVEAFSAMFDNQEHIGYIEQFQGSYGYYGDGAMIDIAGDFVAGDIPLFLQGDKRWGMCNYGRSGTIASSGCGPTSLAMVIVGLSGDTSVNPKVVADWSSANGYRVEGVGTSWGLFGAYAPKYNIHCSEVSVSASAISSALREGKTMITSMGPGHFTRAGHFIVLRGITASGKILVNDPNSTSRSKQEWDVSIIVSEAKAAWAFNK